MKAVIIYDTKTGNSLKLSNMLSDSLKSKNFEVEIIRDKEFKDVNMVKNADLIIIGTPVHASMPAFTLLRKLKLLQNQNLEGKKLIVFGTSRFKDQWIKACEKIKGKLLATKISFIGKFGCLENEINSKDQIQNQINEILKNI